MTQLIQKLCSKSNLYSAWDSLNKSNPSSHGIDGITIRNFEANLKSNIRALQKELKENKYNFQPLRGHLIDKDGGKKRPLKIPTVKDRIVQRAIRNVIERRFNKFHYPCSYGYRERLSREDAVNKIISLRDKKYWYVLEADIKSFFDCVNQDLLASLIFPELPDESINPLIKNALSAEIGNRDDFSSEDVLYFPDGTVGIPQGGILSPLFANVYLSSFDKHMLGLKHHLIRYADDFVVLCKTEAEAHKAYNDAKTFLENNLKLTVHPLSDSADAKTRVTHFGEGFSFLGFTFNHKKITPTQKSIKKFQQKTTEILNPKSSDNLIDAVFKLKNTILGWGNAYSFCHVENMKSGNKDVEKIFERLNQHIQNKIVRFLDYCEFQPKGGRWRGFHFQKLGIPSLLKFTAVKAT